MGNLAPRKSKNKRQPLHYQPALAAALPKNANERAASTVGGGPQSSSPTTDLGIPGRDDGSDTGRQIQDTRKIFLRNDEWQSPHQKRNMRNGHIGGVHTAPSDNRIFRITPHANMSFFRHCLFRVVLVRHRLTHTESPRVPRQGKSMEIISHSLRSKQLPEPRAIQLCMGTQLCRVLGWYKNREKDTH